MSGLTNSVLPEEPVLDLLVSSSPSTAAIILIFPFLFPYLYIRFFNRQAIKIIYCGTLLCNRKARSLNRILYAVYPCFQHIHLFQTINKNKISIFSPGFEQSDIKFIMFDGLIVALRITSNTSYSSEISRAINLLICLSLSISGCRSSLHSITISGLGLNNSFSELRFFAALPSLIRIFIPSEIFSFASSRLLHS